MADNQAYYRVNTPGVLYEQFDDELVAINLDSGSYHSLVGAAADAFLLLASEASIPELAVALSRKYAATAAQIETALGGFADQLLKEKLIAVAPEPATRAPLHLPGNQTGVAFVPPNVAAYHDLQSLFLLDPIHEVGEQGWPQAPSPGGPDSAP